MSIDIKKIAEDLFNVVVKNDELREGFLKTQWVQLRIM